MFDPTTLHSCTLTSLKSRLAQLRTTLQDEFYEACCILQELAKRGHVVPSQNVGTFRWYADVASGRLHPRAALLLAGSQRYIKEFIGLPLETQNRLVSGTKLTVAVLRTDGQVVADEKTLAEIPYYTFKRVFYQGSIRTFEAQKEILLGQQIKKPARRSETPATIRVDKKSDELVVGQVRLSVMDVAQALSLLGYKVERRDKPRVRVPVVSQVQAH